MVLPYDRVLRDRQIPVNKSDTTWSWSFTMPCQSLKGILVLFEAEESYHRDTSRIYNLKIEKVSVIIEGKPNQLYAQGMRSFEQYDEIRGMPVPMRCKSTDRYALWLDFRMINKNVLIGMGRGIGSTGGGITLQIKKKAETAEALKAYIYLIMDSQLNRAFVSAVH